VLPIAMIGISARPAGSLGKMLHQFREQAEGATSRFLLTGDDVVDGARSQQRAALG
jgi:hypothetical protein